MLSGSWWIRPAGSRLIWASRLPAAVVTADSSDDRMSPGAPSEVVPAVATGAELARSAGTVVRPSFWYGPGSNGLCWPRGLTGNQAMVRAAPSDFSSSA